MQIGRRDAAELGGLERIILPSYVDGLRAEGCDVDASVVRRGHALQLMVFTGLSTLPFEHLAASPSPALHRLAAQRAAVATFSLDLLAATEPHPSTC